MRPSATLPRLACQNARPARVVVVGLMLGEPLDVWTALFLAVSVPTSVTGFLFPFQKLLPSHIVSVSSLVILALAICARYATHLTGSFAWIYVVGAVLAQYLAVGVQSVLAFHG